MSKKELICEVEAMTSDERKVLKSLYKRYLIAISLVIALGVGMMIGIFSYAQARQIDEEQNFYRYRDNIKHNASQNTLDYSLYEQAFDSADEYISMQKLKSHSIIILFVAVVAGVISVWYLFRKKFPEFSVRKHFYLIDIEKEADKEKPEDEENKEE